MTAAHPKIGACDDEPDVLKVEGLVGLYHCQVLQM